MKKILFYLFYLSLFYLVFSEDLTYIQKNVLLSYAQEYHPINNGYHSVYSYKGNYTDSGEEEYFVFICTTIKFNTAPSRDSIRLSGVVIFSSDNQVKYFYQLPYSTSIITKGLYEVTSLGPRMSQGWIVDLNRNGKSELLLTESAGSYVVWNMWEFHNGEFKLVLPFKNVSTKIINADYEKKTLYVSRSYKISQTEGSNVVESYTWDEESQMFAISTEETD